jgi:predicted ribosomally synthesized peptide with SipW-like signal peptide
MNKKILASIFVIGILAFAMGWGTYSYFSDTERSTGNIFKAGTLDITVTGDGYTWSTGAVLEGLKPCETGWIRFTINNPGDNTVDVWKHLKVTGLGGGTPTDSEYEEGLCTFATSGDGVAGWSAVGQGHSGDYSAKLYAPAGVDHFAGVRMRVGIPFGDISDPSYWFWYSDESDSFAFPYIYFILDTDKDQTTAEFGVLLNEPSATYQPTEETWNKWDLSKLDDWHVWNIATGNTYYKTGTLAELQADAEFKDAKVIRVYVAVGTWGNGPVTGYVDDVTVNGVTYNLEPGTYIEKCDLDNVITYDLWTSARGWIIEEAAYAFVSDIDCKWIYLGTIPAGGSMYVQQSYHMVDWVTNWAQGDWMTFDIEIYAEQEGGPGPA